MEKKKNLFWIVLFCGSVWGIVEATLGYALHFISLFPGFSGMILFPFAVYILRSVYLRTDSAAAVLLTGATAAMIKCVDFLFPFMPPIKTLNPVMSIIIEVLFCALFLPVVCGENIKRKIASIFSASFLWRIAFIAVNIIVFLLIHNGILKYGPLTAIRFVMFDGIVSGMLAWLILLIPDVSEPVAGHRLLPAYAAGAFSAAVCLELVFFLV